MIKTLLTIGLCALTIFGLASGTEAKKNPMVELTIGDRGTITIELYEKEAPQTVKRMLELFESGFYTKIAFHRVIPNFVAQTGDPKSKDMKDSDIAERADGQGSTQGLGEGGSGKNIPFEVNELKHVRGTLGMALSAPMSDTGDSQWFINLKDNTNLNGKYCVFGKVVKGLDLIEEICRGDRITKVKIHKAEK